MKDEKRENENVRREKKRINEDKESNEGMKGEHERWERGEKKMKGENIE